MKKGFFVSLVIISLFMNCVLAQELKNVNFLQEGEVTKLILTFDQNVFAERKHLNKDKQIVLDIRNAKADPKHLRGFDTSEFNGSAVYVSGYKKPGTENDLRFTIQLRDNVRSVLESKNGQVVLAVENRFGVFSKKKIERSETLDSGVVDATTGIQGKVNIPKSDAIEDILENLTLSGVKRYVGKKISIQVNELPYTEILRMIADTSGFNIIIDDAVNKLPPLTLNLTNIPWDQALDTVLSLGKLVAQRHANILMVRTEAQLYEEKQKEFEAKSKNTIKEPLVTKIFPLSFADQKEMMEVLKAYSTPERGAIQTDVRTNSLIVKDTVEVIDRMKKIIEYLDTQTPQVLIESKIVEATEDYEFKAGLGGAGITTQYNLFNSNTGSTGQFSFNSAPNSTTTTAFGASITLFKKLNNLNFTLDLMEKESKARVISSPRIITKNNIKATITNTESRYFRTVLVQGTGGTATSNTQLQQIDANVSLDVTPQVTNDGSISMKVDINKSSFLDQTTTDSLPTTSNSTISTNVLVDNGSTVVIGGLYTSKSSETVSGIPYLKDIPILGWLFRSAHNPKNNKSELIVFLTPRVINQEEAGLVQGSGEISGIK